MKHLLLLVLLAACTDQPTKEESIRVLATANGSLAIAQSNAVDAARTGATSSQLSLKYTGPCELGGTVRVTGDYTGQGHDDLAAFDLNVRFFTCTDAPGYLNGNVHWTSRPYEAGFSAAMTGDLNWKSTGAAASCDFDLQLTITDAKVSYAGLLCGYTMTELGITLDN